MRYERYDYRSSVDLTEAEFTSVGKNGQHRIIVNFHRVSPSLYNLGFCVYDGNSAFDDLFVINNGDTTKLLATVADCTMSFLENYPQASIFFEGSTKSRTRLYQIGISLNLEELSKKFLIFGFNESGWLPFQSGTIFYAFSVRLKLNHDK